MSALLAKKGYRVTLLEKNEQLGGRASRLSVDGFTFDMGPTWYLMPDVFDHFFRLLGTLAAKELSLVQLQPSDRIYFKGSGKTVELFADRVRDRETFERLEPGAGAAFISYLDRSKEQYEIAKRSFLYRNYDHVWDFLNRQTLVDGTRLSVFRRMHGYVSSFFRTPEAQKLMEYQLVFLGSSPYQAPALYNLMSHVDYDLGVFYPMGGIYEVVRAIERLARASGVEVRTQAPVERILVERGRAVGVRLESGEELTADAVVSNADPRWTDEQLLPAGSRDRSAGYWRRRTLAPSAFILFLGVKKKFEGLRHHSLLFTEDWKKNFMEIFERPAWPEDPSLYVCAPSVTDPSVAPPGHENLFVLVPIAPGLADHAEAREAYAQKILRMMEEHMGFAGLRENLVLQRSFCVSDFASRYHADRGTALGLAHTLAQTAVFRPNNISKRVGGLYYVGAGTNPGIGMPVCLVSAELAYKRIVGDRSIGPLETL